MSGDLKPLIEHLAPAKFTVLQEKVDNNNWMTVRGRFQMGGVKNGNGRVYTRGLWENQLNNPEQQKRMGNNGMTGVVEHPDSGQTHLLEVSHIVKKLWLEGDEVQGEALVLDTVPGIHLQKLFRAGVPVGISSRGRGTSVMRDGVEYVEEASFKLDTFDFVSTPSVEGAYPRLAESLSGPYKMESSMDAKQAEIRRLQVRAYEIKEALATTDTKQLDKFVLELIESESKIQTLLGQQPSLKKDGDEALAVIQASRTAASAARDRSYNETAAPFAARVQAAIAPPVTTSSANTVTVNGSFSGATTASAGSELLAETFARLSIADRRIAELERRLVESTDSVPKGKFEAAKKLAAALIDGTRKVEQKLAEKLKELHKVGTERASALSLLEAFVKRNDEAKLLRRIREALADNPSLRRVEPLLRKQKTIAELDEMIEIQVKAFNPARSKRESAATDAKPKVSTHKVACAGCHYVTEAETTAQEISCPQCGQHKLAPQPRDNNDPSIPHQPAFESALPNGPQDRKPLTEDASPKPETKRDMIKGLLRRA